MRIRTLLMTAAAVALPLGSAVAAAGPSSAIPVPTGKGSVTCSVGGDATFTPPLTPGGTPHVSHEVIQFNLTATGCSGPGTNMPVISPTSGTFATKAIRYKDAKVGKTRVAGACADGVTFNPKLLLKSTVAWASVNVKPSVTTLGPLSGTNNGTEAGFAGTGTSRKSYHGASSVTLLLEPTSLTAIENTCKDGDVGTSVSEIDFDSSTSTVTVG